MRSSRTAVSPPPQVDATLYRHLTWLLDNEGVDALGATFAVHEGSLVPRDAGALDERSVPTPRAEREIDPRVKPTHAG